MAAGTAMPVTTTPTPATWIRQKGRRHVLVDATGAIRGTLQLRGLTLQRASAEVAGTAMELRGWRMLHSRISAAASEDGRELLVLRTGVLRWHGSAEAPGLGRVPVRASPVRGGCVEVGDPPLLRAREDGRDRLQLALDPAVPSTAPALLAGVLLLVLHRREMSESG